MKKTIAVLLAVVFSMSSAFAQQALWKSQRHSVFAGAGVNMFMGDLGGGSGDAKHALAFRDMDKQAFRPSITAGYKYRFAERWYVRANVLYSILNGDDSNAGNDGRHTRNLNFKSNLWDLGATVDFYFIKEKNLHTFQALTFRRRWAAYLFIGGSGVHYNPKGEINGSWEELRPLHTEGQETGDSYTIKTSDGKTKTVTTDDEYGKWTFSYPFGVGVKFALNQKWSLGLEVSQRYTTTDYLDDVASEYYYNYNDRGTTAPSELTMAAADKHLNADGTVATTKYSTGTTKRGDSDYKDSYWTILLTAHYKLMHNSGTQYHHLPKYY